MKPFVFQKFDIQQQKNVFRVGTDAVLLGALCSLQNAKNGLEVGSGTGVISLMLAQRNQELNMHAIDIDENAAALSRLNFEQSPFKDRLKALHLDFSFMPDLEKYDLVVSNPPYFEENESTKDVIARQKRTLGFTELLQQSANVLSSSGILSIIVPAEAYPEIKILAANLSFNLIRKVNIFGSVEGKLKRLVLEYSFQNSPLIEEQLIIEKSPRVYSDHYKELTKEFHVFGGRK